MAAINPRQIAGTWFKGVALDVHTISSTHIGNDAQGRPQFDTKRSDLGELMYRLKYQQNRTAADEIIATAAKYLQSHIDKFDVLIPVPASAARNLQPVTVLAEGIAAAVQRPLANCIGKTRSTSQLKDMVDPEQRKKELEGLYSVEASATEGKRILLIDDLYRSGATVNAVSEVLMKQGKAASVRLLAITCTRINQ